MESVSDKMLNLGQNFSTGDLFEPKFSNIGKVFIGVPQAIAARSEVRKPNSD